MAVPAPDLEVSRDPEAANRRAWIWHSLFAVSLVIPTGLAASDASMGIGRRTATVAIAAVWTAVYLVLVRRVDDWDGFAGNRMFTLYFGVAIGFATVLILRHPAYSLLVYSLYPQAFLFLGRWAWAGVGLVTAVLALGVVPRAEDEPGAAVSVMASGAVAVAIGYFVEGVHGQSRRRRQALDELHRIHRATRALASARGHQAVLAALRAHLGSEGDSIDITDSRSVSGEGLVVALGSTLDEVIVVTTDRTMPPEEELRWQAIGPHVGVVLDNLRLAERARKAGVFQERERLAREVHDTLAQALTSIVTQLEAAEVGLRADPTAVVRRLSLARESARQGLDAARTFIRGSRPVELDDATLATALGRAVERWSDETSIPARLAVSGEEAALPADHEAALLRVTQGALANSRQHSACRTAWVELSYGEREVMLVVGDDGVGFDPVESAARRLDGSGFGHSSMRDRIEELGGRITVTTARDQGTTVSAVLPLDPRRWSR